MSVLPPSSWEQLVFPFLSLESLLSCRAVCSSWKKCLDVSLIWRRLLFRFHLSAAASREPVPWKALMFQRSLLERVRANVTTGRLTRQRVDFEGEEYDNVCNARLIAQERVLALNANGKFALFQQRQGEEAYTLLLKQSMPDANYPAQMCTVEDRYVILTFAGTTCYVVDCCAEPPVSREVSLPFRGSVTACGAHVLHQGEEGTRLCRVSESGALRVVREDFPPFEGYFNLCRGGSAYWALDRGVVSIFDALTSDLLARIDTEVEEPERPGYTSYEPRSDSLLVEYATPAFLINLRAGRVVAKDDTPGDYVIDALGKRLVCTANTSVFSILGGWDDSGAVCFSSPMRVAPSLESEESVLVRFEEASERQHLARYFEHGVLVLVASSTEDASAIVSVLRFDGDERE